MLNFLFVYSSGCHQAAQRGFAGPSEGMGKSVCLAFLGWALGSAGSVDLEVSLTSAEVGAWAYPLTSARAKFKSLMAEMSPVVTQWWVWKGMREKKKEKKPQQQQKRGKTREKENTAMTCQKWRKQDLLAVSSSEHGLEGHQRLCALALSWEMCEELAPAQLPGWGADYFLKPLNSSEKQKVCSYVNVRCLEEAGPSH